MFQYLYETLNIVTSSANKGKGANKMQTMNK